ncbi:MAG: hypothetical protein WC376_04035 [Candidatus Nanoarchaeia archaeon]|jgi:hypothetical protein
MKKEGLIMVNTFAGWMGIKNALLASRESKEMSFKTDTELLSNFLLAVNYYSITLTDCNIQSITYFEKAHEKKGLSFRISEYEGLTSVVIDEVKSCDEDFLFFEDTRAKDLMNIFYKENKQFIDCEIYNTIPLKNAVFKGGFSKKYEEFEKINWKGDKKYFSSLLKMYGLVNKGGKQHYFQKNPGEFYTIRPHEFSKNDDYCDEQLMNMIKSLSLLESELFMENEIKDSFLFFTMNNDSGKKYLIAEYKKKSEENPLEFDSLGVVVKIVETDMGELLPKKIVEIKEVLLNNIYSWDYE